MTYLLDTHSLIWFIGANPKLPDKAKVIIEDTNAVCFISVASFWEIAIKMSLGKLKMDIPFTDLENWVISNKMHILPVNFNHTLQLSQLPFHHRDPFDRTLIAQALQTDLILISKEELFDKYNVKRVWN